MSAVMSPQGYAISTQFVVNPHVPGLNVVTRQLMGIDRQVTGLAANVSGRLGRAFMGLAGGVGIASLLRGIVGINTEIENATVGIASMYNALGRMPWQNAMNMARTQLRGLRQDAAAGVGELSDYVQGFQRIFSPAAAAGLSTSQIRELNRLAIGTAGAQGRSLALGPMDVVQALTSGATDRNTPMVTQALAGLGITNEQFNALSQSDKGETLMRAFKQYEEGVKAFGRTFSSQFDTLKDRIKDIARTATGPLFERWTQQLTRANEWLERHEDTLTNIAENIGPKLVRIWEQIGKNALPAAMVIAGTGAAGGVMRSGLAGAVAPMFASSAFRGTQPPGTRWNATAGRWQNAQTGQFVAGIGARAATSGGPWGMLVAAGAAAIVGVVTAAFMSAVRRFPMLGAELSVSVGGLLHEIGELGSSLLNIVNNPLLADIGRPFVVLGDKLIKGVVVITRALTAMVESFDYAMRGLQAVGHGTVAMASGNKTTAVESFRHATRLNQAAEQSFVHRMAHLFDPIPFGLRRGKRDDGTEEGDPTGDNNFNFNGPITIKIEAKRMDDPNVVATTMDEVFRRLAEYPLAGRRGLTR